ncbi:AfsR/SARP family transcriptional regulator [Streptomyces cacaoi]|uniref:OmpR/PhoB-type domain-containing protein n=2 Tax=Streptomyces cacaoi TaxID=1898 RepID=A0A4Y3R5E5_STRCI|nr:BTAD domain-containing putative transcriptional regulator [Streptomyces cacaoi]NNG89205.1 AAA family ATPase [Streptomyces cacaoi]GEB52057.1 hypothetical protein SCA03_46080 [Streptomyces cacaoi]
MRYLILGASEARDEAGRTLPLGGQRLRALLAALALRAGNRGPVSPETLISEVWADTEPEALPENTAAALQALIGRLRKALGKESVESVPGGYRLGLAGRKPEDEVDLLRFQRLVADGERALEEGDPAEAATVLCSALALWRGPALADLPDRLSAAARVEALRRTALHRRITADLALGRAAQVLPEARELAAERPLDEPVQALYLRALRDSGRTAEALEVYETIRNRVADRLGADPGAELRALHAELLRGDTDRTDRTGRIDRIDRPGPADPAYRTGHAGAHGPRPLSAPGSSVTAPGDAPRAPADSVTNAVTEAQTPAVRHATDADTRTPPGPEPTPPGHAADPTARAAQATGHAADPTGRASETTGRAADPTRRAADPAGEGPGPAARAADPGDIAPGIPYRSGSSNRPGNLRARLTSFVGRESDIATITADLAGSRLVTLTGPGGSGKTRLAEQVAATAASAPQVPYRDGTWMVELAPLDHPTAVPGAVLSALGRRETALSTAGKEGARSHGDGDATRLLVERLEHRRLLLVLDNCEHVVEAAAHLGEVLLGRCPGLTVLATSREPLGVPGETVRAVEPLPPAPAHRLFADRGAAARPGFRVEEDADAVAEICRRLDGLPLAIELAAARLRSLTPRQIADRLDDRFRLLTSGSRTMLPRQQTLRAVVDWSWDLLDERERTVLRRLSVFAGGCTLPAAEHVCATAPLDPDSPEGPDGRYRTAARDGQDGHEVQDRREDREDREDREEEDIKGQASDGDGLCEEDVLDILSSLVDKSIVVAEQPPAWSRAGVRYRMLETIHEYANERAAEYPEEREQAEVRHIRQMARFLDTASVRIRTADQLTWLPRLEADLDNVRAALHRTLRRGDRETMAELVRGVGWFWWLRNYRDEGADWVRAVMRMLPARQDERDEHEEGLYREFQLLSYFLVVEQQSQYLLDDPAHRRIARELIDFFSRPGPASARFPGMLWPFAAYLGDGFATVLGMMDESVDNCRRWSEQWELAVALLFRAHVLIDQPDGLAAAMEDITEIQGIAERTGDRWLLSQLCGLRAEVAIEEGRYDDARAECGSALRYAQQLGALTEIPVLLTRIADIWYRQGDTVQADSLAVRAHEDAERLGVRDAQTLATYLRALVAIERGDAVRARLLLTECDKNASAGTPPPMFRLVMQVLDARVLAEEDADRITEALRRIRTALHTALEGSAPESIVVNTLMVAGYLLHLHGNRDEAVEFADAARALRGELPLSVPELRLDSTVRAHSTTSAPGPGTPDAAEPSARTPRREPLTPARAAARLDALSLR